MKFEFLLQMEKPPLNSSSGTVIAVFTVSFGSTILSWLRVFKWWVLLSESAITTNQSLSCFLAHSAQHCTLWEHRKRVRPAGLPIPGPGSLLLHQRVLAEASPDTMTVESIYESFLTLLMAGIQSGTVC